WMMSEQPETDAKLLETLVRSVATFNESISAPWIRALSEEQKTQLKSALPTVEGMKFLGTDDVTTRDVSPYGIPTAQLRYYRMKHDRKVRYFKFYLSGDGKIAALNFWDD